MSKHMLGSPGDSLLGITFDFISKLRSGAISTEDAKRFLRKEDTVREIRITGELQKAVEALIDKCDGNEEAKYLAIAEFMLAHGFTKADEVGRLYGRICPEFRQDFRYLTGTSYRIMATSRRLESDMPRILSYLYNDGKGRSAEEIREHLRKSAEAHQRSYQNIGID